MADAYIRYPSNPANSATSSNVPNTIVSRDGSGASSFGLISANGISVGSAPNTISGLATVVNGAGTLTLPSTTSILATLALTETLTNKSLSGSSNTFTNIPNGATTATSSNVNSTIVSRDGSGNFNMNILFPVGISGITDGSNAAAGSIGEQIKGTAAAGTSVGTSTQRFDATSVPLTAGRWELSGVIYYSKSGATLTAASGWEIGISSTTGNSTTGLVLGDNWLSQSWPDVTNVTEVSMCLAGVYVTISTPTTYYLKARGVYSAGTPQYGARLKATRI